MLGPSPVNGTLIISMPKCSVIAKWRSYPGTGQMNLILDLPHGSQPPKPNCMPLWMVSYIKLSELLPPTKTSEGSSPRISANSLRISGTPSRPP